jgi:hypothetical protein
LDSLDVTPEGRILIAGHLFSPQFGGNPEPVVMRLQGGDALNFGALRERLAVEYFHAGYGHYFVTSDIHEIVALDHVAPGGWVRTGRTFSVWDDEDSSLAPMCRFWSDQTWAPKSSHFYTPYGTECATVKNQPEWHFERNAFKVRLPEGLLGARTCPAGSQPLYRAYNNSMTGAPNHRYMTDALLLDQMVAQGWTMEGETQTRVFACVPVQ